MDFGLSSVIARRAFALSDEAISASISGLLRR
jgi:hypothetical protein